MKLQNSSFTREFLKNAYSYFGKVGLYWGGIILLTGCYTVTDDKFLFLKFGYSGSGKTVSDKIALRWCERLDPLLVSSRITPAGLAKLYKRSQNNKRHQEEFQKFFNTGLILLEDLSKSTTKYLRTTTVSFLAGLTKSSMLDDLTFEGGGLEIKLSEEPKKVMISGTPSQYEEMTSTDLFTEYIDRRSITIMSMLNDEEWAERKGYVFRRNILSDSQVISLWERIIAESYQKSLKCSLPDKNVTYNPEAPSRKIVFQKLIQMKGFPENLMQMIDSLAKGHALINGRLRVLEEDYEILDKVFSRYLYLSDMKKKEFLIVEEVLRNKAFEGINIDDLVYLLRIRSKQDNLPEAEIVRKTVEKYVNLSKYLKFLHPKARGKLTLSTFEKERTFIDISGYLQKVFNDWTQEIMEIVNVGS